MTSAIKNEKKTIKEINASIVLFYFTFAIKFWLAFYFVLFNIFLSKFEA